jgi:hypothetical protein
MSFLILYQASPAKQVPNDLLYCTPRSSVLRPIGSKIGNFAEADSPYPGKIRRYKTVPKRKNIGH